jgi:hypothetical protein
MPKRAKKAKITITKNKERHIIYHNRNKAETSKEANKRAKPNYGPRTGVPDRAKEQKQKNPHKHTKHRNEGVTMKDWRANTPRTSARPHHSSTHTIKQTINNIQTHSHRPNQSSPWPIFTTNKEIKFTQKSSVISSTSN